MNKLEQAARALLAHWDTPAWKYLKPTGDLMADLRKALAEPELNLNCKSVQKRLATVWGYVKAEQAEQEPLAYFLDVKAGFSSKPLYEQVSDEYKNDSDVFPLYAAPVRIKDLTGQDLCDLEIAVGWKGDSHDFEVIAKAVIAKFKEKNHG